MFASGRKTGAGFNSRVSAVLAENQSIPATTSTKVLFATEDYDGNNEFTANRFTAKIAGYYHVDTQIKVAFAGVDKNTICLVYKNDVSLRNNSTDSKQDLSGVAGVSCDVHLAVDDYIEIFVYQGDVVNRDIVDDLSTWLNIHRFA